MRKEIDVYLLILTFIFVGGVKHQDSFSLSQKYLRGIRYWSSSKSTRVVVDLSHNIKYKTGVLPNPSRLFVDLNGAVLREIRTETNIEDGLIHKVRVSQYNKRTVRVVVDLAVPAKHHIFPLSNPPRLVIDVFPAFTESGKRLPGDAKESPSLSKQLGLKVQRVVLDPGHGGSEPGAVGRSGLREKTVVFDIAKRTRTLLEQQGFEVLLTRDRDKNVPLEERTAFANQKQADLFISIHANGHRSKRRNGIETFYLALATDNEVKETAAFENAVASKRLGELESILKSLSRSAYSQESKHLAELIQKSIVKTTKRRNRGVKTAPFLVLVGANMPAVLVECGFISNRTEEGLLGSLSYRKKVAGAIAKAIHSYAQDNHLAE